MAARITSYTPTPTAGCQRSDQVIVIKQLQKIFPQNKIYVGINLAKLSDT